MLIDLNHERQLNKKLTPRNIFAGRLSILALVQSLCILYILAWSCSPPLQIDLIYRLAALGCTVLWFVIAFIRGFRLLHVHCIALFFIVIVVLVAYFQSGFSSILKQISLYLFALFFIMTSFYSDKWNEIKWVCVAVLLILCIWNVKTFTELLQHPEIARALVRNDETLYGYLRRGIGGYSLVYPQVCIFPIVVLWTFRSLFGRRIVRGLIGSAWVVTFLFLISKAGYSIAFAATVVSLIVLLFYKRKSSLLAIIVSVLLIVAGALVLLKSVSFQNFLLRIFDGTEVAKKIHDLVNTAETGSTADSIAARINRYQGSIEVFMRYPLTGSLIWGDGYGHSAILDVFAKYGIFGGYFYCRMIFSVPRKMRQTDNTSMIHAANAAMAAWFIVLLLDSAPYSFAAFVFLMVPAIAADIGTLPQRQRRNTEKGEPSAYEKQQSE